MKYSVYAATAMGLAASLLLFAPAQAQYGMDKKQPSGTPELPHCDRALGTAAEYMVIAIAPSSLLVIGRDDLSPPPHPCQRAHGDA